MLIKNDKRDVILEAAVRRFAHFGIQKTTLTEIADDLGMTKQALAYYFPDKQSLSLAVEAQIIARFFEAVETHFAQAVTIEQSLLELPDIKQQFFEKYAMLIRTAGLEGNVSREHLSESRQKVQDRMLELTAAQLQKGIMQGELKPMNTIEVAAVLLDTLSAYEHCAVARQVVPDLQTFAALSERQKTVIQLIINGLKEEAWKP